MMDGDDNDDDDDIRWTTLLRRDNEKPPFGTDCIFKVECRPDDQRKTPFRFCRIFIEKTRNAGCFPVLHRVFIGGGAAGGGAGGGNGSNDAGRVEEG